MTTELLVDPKRL